MRFDGKVAIVTGGASGIGEALVRLLVSEGARVCIADIDVDRGGALARSLGASSSSFHRCDVSRRSDVDQVVAACVGKFSGVDLLFNNAGVGPSQLCRAPEADPAEWERIVAVNLNSIFYTSRAVIPVMRERGGGAIVNNASISGTLGDYGIGAYNATKGAVINYTRALALDHGSENIRVNAVCPGVIDTPMTAQVTSQLDVADAWNAAIPLGRRGRPEEIAKVMAFLASDDAGYMTASIVVVDGGITAHTGQPNFLRAVARNVSTQPPPSASNH